MKSCVVGFVLLFTLACGSPTGPIDGLAVRAAPPVLRLSNARPGTVYTFAIESGLAIRANWGPCSDPATCDGIEFAETRDLPYAQIAGYSDSATHAIVYWWHLVPDGASRFKPDSIRAVGVELHP